MEMKTKKKTMSKEKLIALISREKEIHPNHVRHVIQAVFRILKSRVNAT
jgi:nucleoid DNA-binding protein